MSTPNTASAEGSLPTILFVDDEEKTRKHFKRLFQRQFNILLAEDGIEALAVFKQSIETICVVVTDQRMPNETGTEFLAKVAVLKPGVIRILSTAFAEVDAAIDSVNKGGIYRYITKPWDVTELEVTLTRAVELYQLREERDELVRQKMISLQNLALAERIHSLAALAVFKNSGLRHSARALQALIQLADQVGVASPSGHELRWEEAYHHHRSFLETANAFLPSNLAIEATPDQDQLVPAAPIVRDACTVDNRFQWHDSKNEGIGWPGPAELIKPLVTRLLEGLGAVLSQVDLITARETGNGIELSLSALSLQHGLQPLVALGHPDGAEKIQCIKIAAAFLEWAHQGGTMQILPEPASRTVALRLNLASLGNVDDPWETLAADLTANDLFWQRHLG